MAEWPLTSSAFAVGGTIPRRHTCDGEDRSPPLSWTAPPTGSRSLALILDDPDAPGDGSSTGSPGASARTRAGSPRARRRRVRDATTSARSAIADPAHPAGTAPTATEEVGLATGVGVAELEQALEGKVLAVAELVGIYQR